MKDIDSTDEKWAHLRRLGAERFEKLRAELGGEVSVKAVFRDGIVSDALIDEVVALLDTSDELAHVRFFVTPSDLLDGDTPADAMKRGDRLDTVRLLAAQYGRQGAR